MRRVNDYLIRAAGVDLDLLNRKAPRDRAKYIGMGSVLFVTAAIAAISAGFALYMAVKLPIPFAVVGGLLWGLAIFNIDKWVVATTKRMDKIRKSIFMALPRVFLALILGTVISEPMVLQIFDAEIKTELQVMQAESESQFQKSLTTDTRFASLPQDKTELVDLQTKLAAGVPVDAVTSNPEVTSLTEQLKAKEEALAAAQAQVTCEGAGTCGTGTAGAGRIFDQAVTNRDSLQRERDSLAQQLSDAQASAQAGAASSWAQTSTDLQGRIDALSTQITSAEDERAQVIANHQAANVASDGLLARIEALERIGDKHAMAKQAHILIFLLFLSIELLPTLFKVLLNIGPKSQYEEALDLADASDLETQRLQAVLAGKKADLEIQRARELLEEQERKRTNDLRWQDKRRELDLEVDRKLFEVEVKAKEAKSLSDDLDYRERQRMDRELEFEQRKSQNDYVIAAGAIVQSAQEELIQHGVNSWRDGELARMGNDPHAVVNSGEGHGVQVPTASTEPGQAGPYRLSVPAPREKPGTKEKA